MKTLVLQSYRTHSVPEWIATCLNSVSTWAEGRGYDYKFVGDEFFSFAPDWLKERCQKHFYPITDIARLYLMRDRLSKSCERVVWVDADVIIFDPVRFLIDTRGGYAFSHEVTLGIRSDGQWELSEWGINNAVMVMHRGNPMLDYYIFAAEEIVRHTQETQFSRIMIGPQFLNALSRAMPIERLTCLGLFTPEYMRLLGGGLNRDILAAYRKKFGFPIAGANLCHFVRGGALPEEARQLDAVLEKAIDILVVSRGAVVNDFSTDSYRTNMSRQAVFCRIYEGNSWGGTPGQLYSGFGSENRFSAPYVTVLAEWLRGHEVKQVIDLGCGDFRVTANLAEENSNVSFIGIDIVDNVIEHNRRRYAGLSNVSFQVGDIVDNTLPEGDVCIVRQVLQHYDNDSASKIVSRISSRYRYCFVTEHIRLGDDLVPNIDKVTDEHIRPGAGLQLDLPPFNIPCTVIIDVPYADNEVLRTYLIERSPEVDLGS